MSILAIEISDAGIQAKAETERGGAAPVPSPGYALVEGGRLLTGAEALGVARLKPKRINNRFWSNLDTVSLPRPFPTDLSHADLAYAHLSEVWRSIGPGIDCVLLVLPGTFTDHQLGLTLGIARACGMPVGGMVDAAVAASSGGHRGHRILHLDLQLHRAVLTVIRSGPGLIRERLETSDLVGLVGLQDGWARWVASLLVRDTRFDPLHQAATEQDLYLRLPVLMKRLADSGRAALEMQSAGSAHSVEVTQEQVIAAAGEAYDTLVQLVRSSTQAGVPTTVLLTHRAAGLPGLSRRVGEIGGVEVAVLPSTAAVDGALMHRETIRSPGEALPFATRLPDDITVAEKDGSSPD